jgi:hypothetical protein
MVSAQAAQVLEGVGAAVRSGRDVIDVGGERAAQLAAAAVPVENLAA